jgi:hypothetical protein
MTQPTKLEEMERDPSEDLAEWLQEVGRRRNGPKEPDEALRVHLEQLAGRNIRTREDITEYVNELSDKARDKRTRSQQLKNVLLGVLLVIATLQYYFIEVQLQILAQPTLTVFAPSPELRLPGNRS